MSGPGRSWLDVLGMVMSLVSIPAKPPNQRTRIDLKVRTIPHVKGPKL